MYTTLYLIKGNKNGNNTSAECIAESTLRAFLYPIRKWTMNLSNVLWNVNAQPNQYIETLSWAPTARTTESMKEKEIENEYEHFIFTEWFFEPIEAMRELL